MKVKKVLVMAGGTGGHVFPALAIAKALEREGAEILWLGTRGRMEEMLVHYLIAPDYRKHLDAKLWGKRLSAYHQFLCPFRLSGCRDTPSCKIQSGF